MDLSEFQKYQFFISENGRREIINEMRKFKAQYGATWLKEFKRDFPDLVVIVDLIANHNATDAYLKFQEFVSKQIDSEIKSVVLRVAAKTAAHTFLDSNKAEVFKLHSELKAEIDAPRF
jgi:hypothetical protein